MWLSSLCKLNLFDYVVRRRLPVAGYVFDLNLVFHHVLACHPMVCGQKYLEIDSVVTITVFQTQLHPSFWSQPSPWDKMSYEFN